MRISLQATILMGAIALSSLCAKAAELGKVLISYEEMHITSSYGTLFFVEGATRESEISVSQRFVTIAGDGEVNLPAQSGYCFALNHYSREKGFQNLLRRYRAKFKKFYKANTKEESFSRLYIPTAIEQSEAITNLCIAGIRDVLQIRIEFSSNDGPAFNHSISFLLR